MNERIAFRLLVLAEIAFAIGAGVIDATWPSLLPEPIRQGLTAYEATRTDGLMLGALMLPVLILALVSSIGLLLFWSPARWLYAIGVLVSIPATLVLGPDVASAPAATLFMLAEVTSGVIMAAMFLPPVARHFEPAAGQASPG
jgi:hypothetical protein